MSLSVPTWGNVAQVKLKSCQKSIDVNNLAMFHVYLESRYNHIKQPQAVDVSVNLCVFMCKYTEFLLP